MIANTFACVLLNKMPLNSIINVKREGRDHLNTVVSVLIEEIKVSVQQSAHNC
jgi:hypothetical protein